MGFGGLNIREELSRGQEKHVLVAIVNPNKFQQKWGRKDPLKKFPPSHFCYFENFRASYEYFVLVLISTLKNTLSPTMNTTYLLMPFDRLSHFPQFYFVMYHLIIHLSFI